MKHKIPFTPNTPNHSQNSFLVNANLGNSFVASHKKYVVSNKSNGLNHTHPKYKTKELTNLNLQSDLKERMEEK